MTLSLTLTLVVLAALLVAGILIARRFAISEEQCGGALGTLIAPCVLSIYLIATAMGIVIGWENNSGASDNAVDEAKAATNLYWSTASFPEGEGEQVRRDLRTYLRAVADQDWPAMQADGRLSDSAEADLSRLRLSVNEVPAGDQSEALDRLAARQEVAVLVDQRIQRADSAGDSIPRILTGAAAVTALAVIVMPFGMGVRGSGSKVFWASLNLLLVGGTVAVLLFLDNPYAGLLAIDAGAIEDALQGFDEIDATVAGV
jgi:hypothetical protein